MQPIGKHLTLPDNGMMPAENSGPDLQKLQEISRGLEILTRLYRPAPGIDPEVFHTAAVAMLSRYPIEVVRLTLDPADGLPGREGQKWLPTISELKTECERWHYPIRERERRDASIRQQLAEREENEYQRPEPAKVRERGRVVTYEEAMKLVNDGTGRKILGVFDKDRITPYGT